MASKPDSYVVVYYKGSNDAWDGYGGAVVYTRARTLPQVRATGSGALVMAWFLSTSDADYEN